MDHDSEFCEFIGFLMMSTFYRLLRSCNYGAALDEGTQACLCKVK